MTDTDTNPGTRGQTRSTWRDETHLRGMLLKLMVQYPDASRDELETRYLAKVKKTPALVEEAARRAFDNDLASIQQSNSRQHRRPRPAAAAAASAAATAERVKSIVLRDLKSIVLLDLMQPCGKALRHCTGVECRQAGGWLTAVADRIGDDGVVGARLGEAEVKALFVKASDPAA
jgi:hypothetical protein